MARGAPLGQVERDLLVEVHERSGQPREYYVGRMMSRYSQASVRRAFKELIRRRYLLGDKVYRAAQRSYDEDYVRLRRE